MTAKAPFAVREKPRSAEVLSGSVGQSLSQDAFLSLGCMEGVYDPIVVPVSPAAPVVRHVPALTTGYVLAGVVALVAYLVHFIPVAPFAVAAESGVRHPVSAAILAILLGVLVRNLAPTPQSASAGCKHIVKKLIPIAIVCMGAGLNLGHIASVGAAALVITVVCIVTAFAASYYLGRALGLGPKTSLLIGAGTGICGNSAIVAVAPLLEAKDDDVVLSIGTVNLFGLLAMLCWPLIGGQVGLAQKAFGVWSGTSIHAVPQVVAAGFAYGLEAGTVATAVKLVRVTMLAPMVFILAVLYSRHHASAGGAQAKLDVRYARLVPWFVWGFVALAVANSLGLIPTITFTPSAFLAGAGDPVNVSLEKVMTTAGKVILTLAMAAIGLEVNVLALMGIGRRAILAGAASTAIVGATSLVLILLLM